MPAEEVQLFMHPAGSACMADTVSCVQAGGLPVVQDYPDFADLDSFQQRLDFHYIVQTSMAPGLYYIAVYNNDAYFKVLGLQPACVGSRSLERRRMRFLWSPCQCLPDARSITRSCKPLEFTCQCTTSSGSLQWMSWQATTDALT